MRIAFFGGSFDPPHRGHLAIARAAAERLSLDQVWMAPAGVQPLTLDAAGSSYADRFAMVRLAVDGDPRLLASELDAPRADGKPNYTIDVLRRIGAELKPDDALFLLLGADSLLTLGHWYRAAELLFLADLIVAGRPEFSLEDVASRLPPGVSAEPAADDTSSPDLVAWELRNEAGDRSSLYLMPDLHEEVSATEIRAALAGKKSAAGVLAPAVLRYIEAKGLYR